MRCGIRAGHQAAERVANEHDVLEQQPLEEFMQRLRVIGWTRRWSAMPLQSGLLHRLLHSQPRRCSNLANLNSK